jgi:hypothetical protein
MSARRLVASVSLLTLAMAVLAANAGSCRAQAQSVPNLSGTWELIEFDGTKQKVIGDKFPKLILVISQEGSLIRVTQKRTKQGIETVQDYSYYTDGRGETNTERLELWPREVPKLIFESVSSWQKDTLVTKYDSKLIPWTASGQGARGFYTLNTVTSRRNDEWRLKSDGKTLVLTSSDAQVPSSTNTGSAPDPRLTSGAQDAGMAPFGTFVTNKFVFSKI